MKTKKVVVGMIGLSVLAIQATTMQPTQRALPPDFDQTHEPAPCVSQPPAPAERPTFTMTNQQWELAKTYHHYLKQRTWHDSFERPADLSERTWQQLRNPDQRTTITTLKKIALQ